MPRLIRDTLSYIHNRWICPSDRVVIKHPDCPRGHYRDKDTILLYVMFQVLVDFVEIECGSHWGPYYFETPGQKVYRVIQNLPLLHWLLPPDRNVRRGLHHLRWAMSLKDMPSQAAHANAVFMLYRFWTRSRQARIEPFTVGFAGSDKRIVGPDNSINFSPEYSAYLESQGELENKYEKEDTEMLKILVDIRGGLWT